MQNGTPDPFTPAWKSEPSTLPGLLQSLSQPYPYPKAPLPSRLTPEELHRRVSARMRRAKILRDPPFLNGLSTILHRNSPTT